MKIREIYEIQANHEINVQNGSTQTESRIADQWILRFGYLAAFLGWDHEVDADADEDSEVFATLKKLSPNKHEFYNLETTYGIAGLVSERRYPIKMDA